jgi:hypothetical protein
MALLVCSEQTCGSERERDLSIMASIVFHIFAARQRMTGNLECLLLLVCAVSQRKGKIQLIHELSLTECHSKV